MIRFVTLSREGVLDAKSDVVIFLSSFFDIAKSILEQFQTLFMSRISSLSCMFNSPLSTRPPRADTDC